MDNEKQSQLFEKWDNDLETYKEYGEVITLALMIILIFIPKIIGMNSIVISTENYPFLTVFAVMCLMVGFIHVSRAIIGYTIFFIMRIFKIKDEIKEL